MGTCQPCLFERDVEIVFDYRAADPSSVAQVPAWVEPLQACFHKALGHELPNRLVSAQGLARLLLLEKSDQLDEEARDYLDRLAAAVRHADEMCRALADLGRLLRDPAPAAALNLADMVREAAAEASVLFGGRDIEYHVAEPLPALTHSRGPWQRALALLFRYAVDSTRTGRPVRLEFAGRTTPDGIAIEVVCVGAGRSKDELARLFEPFAQGSAAVTEGLALFPLRLLAASWRGVMRAVAEPERGTRFSLLIPAR